MNCGLEIGRQFSFNKFLDPSLSSINLTRPYIDGTEPNPEPIRSLTESMLARSLTPSYVMISDKPAAVLQRQRKGVGVQSAGLKMVSYTTYLLKVFGTCPCSGEWLYAAYGPYALRELYHESRPST